MYKSEYSMYQLYNFQPTTLVEYCYIQPSESAITQDKIPEELDIKHLKKAPLINEGLKKVIKHVFSIASFCYCFFISYNLYSLMIHTVLSLMAPSH